jgi:hypothetical protein
MNEKVFIVTDLCMWESNKQNKTSYPHAIQVVDAETGQVRYIKSGSRIKFIEGQITDSHSQETYNALTLQKVSSNSKKQLQGVQSKRSSKSKD